MRDADRLRREIESLLRPYLRGLAAARRAREPVKGSTSFGLPGPRDQADIPDPWPGAGATTLVMEHGLLSIDLAALIAAPLTTPATIYLSGSLATYYAAGTLIPGSDPARTEPLVGAYTADPTLTPPPDWPDGAPTLTDSSHPSLHGPGAPRLAYVVQPREAGGYSQTIHPERWTGLARAWMQAMVGAGLSAAARAARIPAGFDAAPGHLGLLQDPATGTYWACDIGPGGLRVHAMTPASLAPVAAWLHAGTLTGAVADLARAYVLADLRPTGAPLTLITAAAMGPVYAGQGDSSEGLTTIWADDAPPAGSAYYQYGDYASWAATLITTDPEPHAGASSHRNQSAAGAHYHGWYNATGASLTLEEGEHLFAWVWLPTLRPRMIALIIQTPGGGYFRQAYWGENLSPWGTDGTVGRMYMGPLPAAGTWTRLDVPAETLALAGHAWTSLYFVCFDSFAVWGECGKKLPDTTWQEGEAWSDQGGWIWAPDGVSGSIITRRVVNPLLLREASQSSLSEVVLTWTDGIPAASLTVGARQQWRPHPGYHRQWHGTAGEMTMIRHGAIWPGSSDCAAAAPVFVTYSTDGRRRVWEYRRAEVRAAGTYTDGGSLTSCYGGATQTVITGTGYILRGGYCWAGDDPPEIAVGNIGWGTKRWALDNVTGIVDEDGGSSYWPSIRDAWQVACGDVVIDQMVASAPGLEEEFRALGVGGGWAIAQSTGDYSAYLDEVSVSSGGGGQIAAYLTDAPDFLWALLASTDSGRSVRARRWDSGDVVAEQRLDYMALVGRPAPPYDDVYRRGLYYGRPSHGWVGEGTPASDTTSSTAASTTGVTSCYAWGSLLSAGASDTTEWSDLAGNGTDVAQVALAANASAAHAAVYTPAPGADQTAVRWDGDIPATDDVVCWVGW